MAVVSSAPGKVLLTGAYLILERPNAGLVLSTSARFYAIVKPIHSTLNDDSWAWSWMDIRISSPQLSKDTSYKLSLKDFTLQKKSPPREDGNAFVEEALQLAVATAASINQAGERQHEFNNLLLQGLEITILGSNDFYSYRKHIEAKGLPLTRSTLASLPLFSPITFNSIDASIANSMLPEVAKTGLGSSAAMTTAVVAGVLHYLGAVQLPSCSMSSWKQQRAGGLHIVHALSQAAHSLAQGKIGSGFDVSAAVYGSQRYVRFSSSILSSAQEGRKYLPLLEIVSSLVNETWDEERQEYALPPLLELVVGEPGFGGSHTPSMVGAVRTWRKAQPENAHLLWSKLGQANADVERGLLQLKEIAEDHKDEYKMAMESFKSAVANQWENVGGDAATVLHQLIVNALSETRLAFQNVRSMLRQMGDAAGVPIEPPSQTALLDATMDMEGVLLAGVPGAGGYDAVFAITIGTSARECVEREWSARGVLALCVIEDSHGVQMEGGDPRQEAAVAKMDVLKLDS